MAFAQGDNRIVMEKNFLQDDVFPILFLSLSVLNLKPLLL